jgi:uncharacterized membrane protein
MGKLSRLYLSFRHPRVFLIALVTFVVVSLLLHFTNGYDSDWGATNLTLSIEASVASAVLTMMAERSAQMQQEVAGQMRQMLEALLAQEAAQERTLKGVLLIAEAQRDMLLDHRSLLQALKDGDERILKTLTEGDEHASNQY